MSKEEQIQFAEKQEEMRIAEAKKQAAIDDRRRKEAREKKVSNPATHTIDTRLTLQKADAAKKLADELASLNPDQLKVNALWR